MSTQRDPIVAMPAGQRPFVEQLARLLAAHAVLCGDPDMHIALKSGLWNMDSQWGKMETLAAVMLTFASAPPVEAK